MRKLNIGGKIESDHLPIILQTSFKKHVVRCERTSDIQDWPENGIETWKKVIGGKNRMQLDESAEENTGCNKN